MSFNMNKTFVNTQFIQTRATSPSPNITRQSILNNPGFGKFYSDHMVAIDWDIRQGWYGQRVVPYAPLTLDPASLVLHYAQMSL